MSGVSIRIRVLGALVVLAIALSVAACGSTTTGEQPPVEDKDAVESPPSNVSTESLSIPDVETQPNEVAVDDDVTPYRSGIKATAARLMRLWMFASYMRTDTINEMFDERYAEYMEQNLHASYAGDELTVRWTSFENTKGDLDVNNMMDDVSRFSLAVQDFFVGDDELERVVFVCDYPRHSNNGLPTIRSAVRVEIGKDSATTIRRLKDDAEHGRWDTVLSEADARVVDGRIVDHLDWVDWTGWEVVPAQ